MLTTQQAAEKYDVSRQVVTRWCNNRKLYGLAGVHVATDAAGKAVRFELDELLLDLWVQKRKAAGCWGRGGKIYTMVARATGDKPKRPRRKRVRA